MKKRLLSLCAVTVFMTGMVLLGIHYRQTPTKSYWQASKAHEDSLFHEFMEASKRVQKSSGELNRKLERRIRELDTLNRKWDSLNKALLGK